MKDKRLEKIKRHYDVYINGCKFKIMACHINKEVGTLSIKTKIRGQAFPMDEQLTITVPSADRSQTLCVSFHSMSRDTSIECWNYTIQ